MASRTPECSNVTLVCHALSGSARVDQWWPDLLERIFDLERECVVCFNLIGSCYGSTSAASLDPATGKPYGGSFPQVTVRDWVRSEKIALEELGIRHVRTAIGPSIGGMQAMQWAVEYPDLVDRVVAMGATQLSALGLGLNHLQREVMRLDPEWRGGDYYDGPGPRTGLAQARAMAMTTYKSAELFHAAPRTQGRPQGRSRHGCPSTAGSTLRATWSIRESCSGSALTPTPIWRLRARWICSIRSVTGTGKAWERVRAKVLLFGISSDVLFPESDVRALAEEMRAAGVDCSLRVHRVRPWARFVSGGAG